MDESFTPADRPDFPAGELPPDAGGGIDVPNRPLDGATSDRAGLSESGSMEVPEMIDGGNEAVAAVALDVADFLPEPPKEPDSQSPALRPRIPGPGLPESLVWLLGLFIVQVAASMVVVVVVLLNYALTFGMTSTAEVLRNPAQVKDLVSENIVVLYAGIQFAVIVAAIAAGLLRLGKERHRKLPLGPIPLRHCVLLGLLMIPLVMFCGQLYGVSMQAWESIVRSVPELNWMNEQGSMKEIETLAGQASLSFLLVAIAIVPAIAEELIFRGIIGRGLVARWGLLWGIVITSVLFAAMHLHPAQAFALLPLAVAMHVAYLSTRSFWVPMGIHFINNAWAAVAMKTLAAQPELLQQDQQSEISWPLLAASGWCVATMICLIWHSRVRYVQEDGVEWDPGYVTVETPPPEAPVTRCYGALRPSYLFAALSGLLLFAACVYSVLQTGALDV